MMWLLVDNSNTRTKFALADRNGLRAWRGTLATADLAEETLDDLVGNLAYQGAVIASVVPAKERLLFDYLSRRVPTHRVDWRSPLGMGIDYPEPAQIGADRLVNAVGVMARYGTPAIVVDSGTAVTFDVVSAAPAYCGGVIAPGVSAMTRYLAQATALLPQIELAEPTAVIGKSTVEAMRVGAVIGYRGMVRGILAGIRAEMDGDPVIVATGGDAGLLAKGLPEISAVDPDLTLEGIRQVAMAVFGKAARSATGA